MLGECQAFPFSFEDVQYRAIIGFMKTGFNLFRKLTKCKTVNRPGFCHFDICLLHIQDVSVPTVRKL